MANKTQVQLYHDTLQGVIGERSELQKRVRELEAALREIAGNGNVPPASRQFKTADYRAGYIGGYLAQAEIAKAALTPLETPVESLGWCVSSKLGHMCRHEKNAECRDWLPSSQIDRGAAK